MKASRLADVLVRDPQPPVLFGLRDHRLEQPAIGLGDISPPCDLRASVAKARCKRVANPLEVAEAQNSGATHRTHRQLELAAGEVVCEELAELAFEPGDLAAQVGAGAAVSGGEDRLGGQR